MANFQVGDIVIPHEYEKGKPVFCDGMRKDVGKPCKIEEVTAEVLFRINGYFWPASALEPILPEPTFVHELDGSDFKTHRLHDLEQQAQLPKPKYDLKEFTLAAMNGICASSPAWSGNMELGDFGSMAVRIARATIKALQDAEKEEKP